MTDSEIDDAILSSVETSWKKVAMVIGRAAKKLPVETDEENELYHAIAKRIKALVSEGRLAAQGDVTLWRHSEVKQP